MATDLIEGRHEAPVRVLIAGGGVAALEAVLALRELSPTRFEITLLAPDREFHARPFTVGEPFGLVERKHMTLAGFAADNGARLVQGTLAAVDVAERLAETGDGVQLSFDALLVATGAAARPVLAGALTFRGPADVPAFRMLLDEIEAGEVSSIAFAFPRPARWSLPLYELALMTKARAAARGLPLRVDFATHERRPLEVFGRRASDRVRRLLERAGIRLTTQATPLVAQPGRLFLAHGRTLAVDRVVAAAKLVVPRIEGLPHGPGGFIPTDPHSRVDGAPGVYAAGDATWYPVKQGGVAADQADAAAQAIAQDAGLNVVAKPFVPVLRGILLTGDESLYVRSEPGGSSDADERPLWLPAAKIAGRLLGPYMYGHDPDEPRSLSDLQPRSGAPGDDHRAALELALEAADAAAAWDDPEDALRWLGVAEGLNVAIPMRYAEKRREWSDALAARSG